MQKKKKVEGVYTQSLTALTFGALTDQIKENGCIYF